MGRRTAPCRSSFVRGVRSRACRKPTQQTAQRAQTRQAQPRTSRYAHGIEHRATLAPSGRNGLALKNAALILFEDIMPSL
eukprot:6202068-Pleurochrysis_carterae.AAC.4